jgi:anti-sigma factor (TIGR02949 family)
MNRMQFGEGGCEKIRKYLDSYVSNELLVETNHDVLRHIENCTTCAAELDARTRVRTRLKAAVKNQSVPPELQVRIREHIHRGRPHSWAGAGWVRWAGAIAAVVLVCAGLWVNYSGERRIAVTDRPAQNAYIQRISARMAAVLKVGLGDHIHCAVFRKYPKNPPSLEQMEADLGPAYQGLLPVVRGAVPDGYRVVMAHQCTYAGRKFIHFTFEKGGDLISLVISRRNAGESMEGLAPAGEPSGMPIYQSAAGRYQVAGFEAGGYLAYVVSDLKGHANLQVAAELGPNVREFLMKTPA